MAQRENDITTEVKHYWRGFLIDLNVQDTVPLFGKRRARITNYRHDHETVHEAWEDFRTIVTCNEKHFTDYILEHSKRDSGKTCQDCWGLLVVPSDAIVRTRVIKRAMKNGVQLGGEIVPWSIVAYLNLCVTLRSDGRIAVRKFRRCEHCKRTNRVVSEWYDKLPELGTRKGSK